MGSIPTASTIPTNSHRRGHRCDRSSAASGVIAFREALLRRAGVGAGVLVSSHHLDEVARVADRISVINAGRMAGTIDPHGVDIERSFFALVHADDLARGETR